MIYILHIDTSGDEAHVMVASDGQVLAAVKSSDTRNHASAINRMITEATEQAGITLQDIHAIACCGGPGSYTGLRIGLATAKAICYINDKPLLQHNKLDLLAVEEYYKYLDTYDHYVAILPAREKEYFISANDNNFKYIVAPQHVFEPEVLTILGGLHGRILTKGVLSKTIFDMIDKNNIQYIENQSINIESWACKGFETYNCNDFVNLSTAEPLYLKQVYTHK